MKRITSVMLAVLLIVVSLMSVGCEPAEKFKVTFETFDGNSTVVEVAKNGKAQTPADPENSHATFKGWFADASFETAWNPETAITQDTTVYANWKYKYNIVVTFKPNNGGEATKVDAHTGFLLDAPEDPVRNLWTFTGWYTDADCTKICDTTAIITSRTSFTLYAGWELAQGHVHEYTLDKTVAPTCETIGYDIYVCACGEKENRNTVQPLGHTTEAGDDYIRFYPCSVCKKSVRKDSVRTYDEVFKYEFTKEKADEFDLLYQEILDILSSADRYSADYARTWDATNEKYDTTKDVPGLYDENKAFEEKFNAYYDKILYVIEQYQYAYVFYCVHDGDAAYEKAYDYITEYRTDMVKNFYSLYRLIHETKYREFFFAYDEGWTEEDIHDALVMSDSYGGDKYASLNKKSDDIQMKFRELEDPATSDEVPGLYSEFVKVNNQIAQLSGYDNYMDYAYDSIYGRDYTPDDVIAMRNYVRTYIAPLFNSIRSKQIIAEGTKLTTEQKKYVSALSDRSIFQYALTADIVAGYLDTLHSEAGQAGKKEINFAHHANELFKNGNYYTGSYEGAFSYFVRAQQTSILYFGPGSYSGAFTFVHEFGHYYETVYNPGVSISYDLEETHSQGNEMLFLAYLSNMLKDVDCDPVFLNILLENTWNATATILASTAVNEFEHIAYTGEYYGQSNTIKEIVSDGKVEADEYDEVFSAILADYGVLLNDAYWRYVAIEAAGYYISYAMSALPSMQLLTKGVQDFEAAKQSYFKLFTFTDNPEFAETDEFGDVIVTAGYAETLQYAGLYSPFQEELYVQLKNYFDSL